MTRAATLVALVLALLSGGIDRARAAPDHFRRGVSIHNLMNWATPNADKTGYALPLFPPETRTVTDAEFAKIRSAGFDFVRLTVDPGPFMAFDGQQEADVYALLVANVKRMLDIGLDVMVDFHPNTQIERFSPGNLVRGADDPDFLRYRDVIAKSARALKSLPEDRVAIEPMNEPPAAYGRTAGEWQTMMEALYAAARAEAPRMTVVVTGGRGGGAEGLRLLDPTPFKAGPTLYSFHYYEPHIFSHQGSGQEDPNSVWPYLAGLPYPANPDGFQDLWANVTARVQGSKLPASAKGPMLSKLHTVLDRYFSADGKPAFIETFFDGVGAWCNEYGIDKSRVFIGEFGVRRTYGPYVGARDADRERWLAAVRQAADRRGFKWAAWALNGLGGMSVQKLDGRPEIDPVTARALGLNLN